MTELLPYVVIGVASGSVFAIAALGLVLTYKTSGIFNFAHGAIAAASAYLFFELWQQRGLPWPVALAIVLLVAAPAFGILMERLVRSLVTVTPAAQIVATVGLLVAVQGVVVAVYGAAAKGLPQFLPVTVFDLGDVNVSADQFVTVGIALASAWGLYVFFRKSRTGTAMRGVVDNSELLDLAGTSPVRVRRIAWMIGSSFAALSGILIAPSIGLDAFVLTLLVVQGFGAAAIGAFSSLPLTYAGGLVVGVGAALSTRYVADVPALRGFPASFPFVILFVTLLVIPRHRLVEVGADVRRRLSTSERVPLPRPIARSAAAIGLALLLFVPAVVGPKLPVYSNAVVFALLFASLGLLVRMSGQISLAHAALAAVGATAFSHLAHGVGVPWFAALLGAGLVATPVGAIVAIPAIRLSGLYLALATFGFGLLMERLVYGTFLMFGGTGSRLAPRPSFAGSDTGYYYVALAVVLAGMTLVYRIDRARLGRLLRALDDSPLALATHGASVNVTRVIVFCASAFLAGVAGALFAGLSGSVSGVSYSTNLSLMLLVVLFVAGSHPVAGPFLAAGLLVVTPSYFNSELFTDLQPVVFGILAVVAAVASDGRFRVRERVQAAADRARVRRSASPVRARFLPTAASGRS